MTAHEPRLAHENFGNSIDDLKPVIGDDASDSAALDSTIELLVKSNKSLPMAKILTIPEAWSHRRDFSQKLKNLYAYATADGGVGWTSSDLWRMVIGQLLVWIETA